MARFASATTAAVQTVLPTPGPPVRTVIREVKAARTADHCSGVSPACSGGGASGGSWSIVGGAEARARIVVATATSLAWVRSR